jgi:hypothetical protein
MSYKHLIFGKWAKKYSTVGKEFQEHAYIVPSDQLPPPLRQEISDDIQKRV